MLRDPTFSKIYKLLNYFNFQIIPVGIFCTANRFVLFL